MIALALRYWWAIAIALLLVALGGQTMRLDREKRRHAEYREAAQALALAAANEQRTRELKWQKDFNEAGKNAGDEIKALDGRLRAGAATADVLRTAATNAARRADQCARAQSGGAGVAGPSAGRLLADVLGEAQGRLAAVDEYAERLYIAGNACERSADSLTAKPVPLLP